MGNETMYRFCLCTEERGSKDDALKIRLDFAVVIPLELDDEEVDETEVGELLSLLSLCWSLFEVDDELLLLASRFAFRLGELGFDGEGDDWENSVGLLMFRTIRPLDLLLVTAAKLSSFDD